MPQLVSYCKPALPGYIDFRKRTFQQFCTDFKVDSVTNLELKVGALAKHAVAPHYYGFT
jgi:hypothetical protein